MSRKDKRRVQEKPRAPKAAAVAAGSISAPAAELDAELGRFEELGAALRRAPLNSQKTIERAAGILREAEASRARFGAHLHALMEAMTSIRDRHQAASDAVDGRTQEIQQRAAEFTALLERLMALGREASEISVLVQTTGTHKRDAPPASPGEVIEEIRAIRGRMAALVAQAEEFSKAAEAAGMVDLVRQADSLRQTVGSAHNKINLVERSLAMSAPPGEQGAGEDAARPEP